MDGPGSPDGGQTLRPFYQLAETGPDQWHANQSLNPPKPEIIHGSGQQAAVDLTKEDPARDLNMSYMVQ